MSEIEYRIKMLGLEIPSVPVPKYEYVPFKRIGNLVYVSGQGPSLNGTVPFAEHVGKDLTVKQGQRQVGCVRPTALPVCVRQLRG